MMAEQDINIKFVEEVEKHPILYNPKHHNYCKRDESDKTWAEIGKKMDLTATEAKDKWRNLRTVYVRNLKRKKYYYLNDAMKFTLPFIRTIASYLLHDNQAQCKAQPAEEQDVQYYENAEDQDAQSYDNAIGDHSGALPPSPLQETFAEQPFDMDASNRKREAEENTEDVLTTYLNVKLAKLSNPESERTKYSRSFLLSLMPEIERMSESQLRQFRRRVFTLIDEIIDPQKE